MYLAAIVVAVTEARAAPRGWQPPGWWLRQAACIKWAESRDNPRAVGAGSYGLFQFIPSTWASVGGTGNPVNASVREQTYRAWLVWSRDGGSWREWSTARGCGLR